MLSKVLSRNVVLGSQLKATEHPILGRPHPAPLFHSFFRISVIIVIIIIVQPRTWYCSNNFPPKKSPPQGGWSWLAWLCNASLCSWYVFICGQLDDKPIRILIKPSTSGGTRPDRTTWNWTERSGWIHRFFVRLSLPLMELECDDQ